MAVVKGSISIDRRGRWPGNLLLGKQRFDPRGAVPVGEYFLCRFPETLPRGGRGRLSASLVLQPGATAGLFGGHLAPRDSLRAPADRVQGRHRSADSAVRSRSISGLHPLAERD